MSEIQQLLNPLKRPGLLVRAARHGLNDYNRDRHLRRILRADRTPSPIVAARQLIDLEQSHEDRRQSADAPSLRFYLTSDAAGGRPTKITNLMPQPSAAIGYACRPHYLMSLLIAYHADGQ